MLKSFKLKYSRLYFAFSCLLLLACQAKTNNELGDTNSQMATQVNIEALVLDQNQGLMLFEHKPFTGKAITSNADSLMVEEVNYLDGVKNGVMKKWFYDGTLSYEANYDKGKLNGWSKSYWKDGQIRSETFFTNGIVDGVQRQWYKSGQLFKELHYNMGKEEGMQKAWRENGAIYNNFEIVDGRIFGLKRANLCFELEEEVVQYE